MDKKEPDIREQEESMPLDMTVPGEKAVQAPQKGGIIKSVGDFFGSAFGGKSQDMGSLIEEFTGEMTLVAEGLSQDQDRLDRRCEILEARQAESEERLGMRLDEIIARNEETRDTLREMDRRLQKIEEKQKKLEERQEKAEKARKDENEKKSYLSDRWAGVLRQATWLFGILCGAWVIVTIINKL